MTATTAEHLDQGAAAFELLVGLRDLAGGVAVLGAFDAADLAPHLGGHRGRHLGATGARVAAVVADRAGRRRSARGAPRSATGTRARASAPISAPLRGSRIGGGDRLPSLRGGRRAARCGVWSGRRPPSGTPAAMPGSSSVLDGRRRPGRRRRRVRSRCGWRWPGPAWSSQVTRGAADGADAAGLRPRRGCRRGCGRGR